jgi:hypothetical protein
MGDIPRADPAATPRVGFAGEATRAKAIFEVKSEAPPWKVEVVPLENVTSIGRSLTGGRLRPRAIFEVRVEFEGEGLDEFEPYPGKVKRVETWTTEGLERAKAVAGAAIGELKAGREPVLVSLAQKVP